LQFGKQQAFIPGFEACRGSLRDIGRSKDSAAFDILHQDLVRRASDDEEEGASQEQSE
jgi:hypothetical protein